MLVIMAISCFFFLKRKLQPSGEIPRIKRQKSNKTQKGKVEILKGSCCRTVIARPLCSSFPGQWLMARGNLAIRGKILINRLLPHSSSRSAIGMRTSTSHQAFAKRNLILLLRLFSFESEPCLGFAFRVCFLRGLVYFFSATNSSDTEFRQYLSPVGLGPSGNT